MVTPHDLRSLTRNTLLMTSLPRLSKTSTFHIGSPSAFRIGVDLWVMPLTVFPSEGAFGSSWGTWFKLRIFSIEAIRIDHVVRTALLCKDIPICLSLKVW